MDKVEPVDFYINQRPISISFECPHCLMDVEIDWRDVDVPEYWGDDWGEVECPYCEKTIKLGDYDLYCQFHMLDVQDAYEYLSETNDKDIELAYYISVWVEYLNHPLFHNPDFAFADADYAQLGGWITGYNFAKKINVEDDNETVRFKCGRHRVVLHRPYEDKYEDKANKQE